MPEFLFLSYVYELIDILMNTSVILLFINNNFIFVIMCLKKHFQSCFINILFNITIIKYNFYRFFLSDE